MQGLRLSRLFYEEAATPLLQKHLSSHWRHLAFGLVGEGSECFGFDDALSRDHDFGAGFCVWIAQEHMPTLAPLVQEALQALPRTFMGFQVRTHGQDGEAEQKIGQRVGLFSIEEFYARFTNGTTPPQTWQDWYRLPEHFLAVCTNGAVFYDGSGAFSAFRQALLNFYPEDVRKKKLAARLSVMAQSGQYNVLRMLERGDGVGATLACTRFAENALAAFFLVHKRYMPFYKWAFKAAQTLPQGQVFANLLQRVLAQNCMELAQHKENISLLQQAVEALCLHMVALLQEHGLSPLQEPWLMAQAEYVQNSITLAQIKALPVSHGVHYS